MKCLRCEYEMISRGTEKIQLGESGLLFGSWNNVSAGSLEVEIYICDKCGKVEFFYVKNV